jgi:hypothetical protein
MIAPKACKNCGSQKLVPIGKSTSRNQCHKCYAATQRKQRLARKKPPEKKEPKTCKDCQNPKLVPRGEKGFRNQCHPCWAATQKKRWHANRERSLVVSRANYAKHSGTRIEESAAYQKAHPEYRALAEWFRKKKIPLGQIPKKDITALITMKKALKSAKANTSP